MRVEMRYRTLSLTVAVMIAAVAALVALTGIAKAEPVGATGDSRTTREAGQSVETLDTPTAGLLKPVTKREVRHEEGESVTPGQSVTAAPPEWLNGTSSNTYYWNPFFNQIQWLTTQYVGYWGAPDASYPKVGELYYGRAIVANVNPSRSTPVMVEVTLPENTDFYIDPSNPNTSVRCFLDNFNTGASVELTGANCPQAPKQGLHGPQFSPSASYWTIKPGEAIRVMFPVYSRTTLSGIASTPADCMIGYTWVAAAMSVWDEPKVGDACPLPKDHGVYQGVYVSDNPPTVEYPSPSATNITMTTARTSATLYNHFAGGTAYVDLGTTTAYGDVSQVTIPTTSDWHTITTDWGDLKAGTTYHWRLRFVDGQGRQVTGPDQTFTTQAPPPDTTPPTVKRVVPAESATGVGLTSNVNVFFSEAMRPSSINTKTVKLLQSGSTTPLEAVVTYDPATKKAILNPNANLKSGTTYRAIVTFSAKDLAGNSLDQDRATAGNQGKVWTFKTR